MSKGIVKIRIEADRVKTGKTLIAIKIKELLNSNGIECEVLDEPMTASAIQRRVDCNLSVISETTKVIIEVEDYFKRTT